uniref:exodeoxyribonuclease III n=1 Tax=Scleropages formosus TaxID=113540 RepID=A0A8C9SKC9_SCLFO
MSGPSALTGLRVRRHRLFFRTRPVPTSTHQEALTAFLAFLRMLGRPLLVGHSIRRFDCPVLEKFRLNGEFHQATAGFLDTLPLAQDLLRGQGLRSFRQESLVKAVLGIRYPGHDALEDVRALQRLYAALGPTPEQSQFFWAKTIFQDPFMMYHMGQTICLVTYRRFWAPAPLFLRKRREAVSCFPADGTTGSSTKSFSGDKVSFEVVFHQHAR